MKANHDTLTAYQAWLRAAEALAVREREFSAMCEAQIDAELKDIGQKVTIDSIMHNGDEQVVEIVGYTFLYDNEAEEVLPTGVRVLDSEDTIHEIDYAPTPIDPPEQPKSTKRRSSKAKP